MTEVRETRSGARRTGFRSLLAVVVAVVVLVVGMAIPSGAAPGPLCAAPSWVATWAFPMSQPSSGFQGQAGTRYTDKTFRVVATPSLGGNAAKIRLTNALGDAPLTLSSVRIGPSAGGGSVVAGQDRPVTFNGGQTTVTIPTGQTVTSDAVTLTTADFQPLAVSFHAPGTTGLASEHLLFPESPSPSTPGSMPRMYRASGDRAAQASDAGFDGGVSGASFLTGIDVFTVNDGAIVTFGDSITEGYNLESVLLAKSAPWPATLATRLRTLAQSGGPRFAVVNVSINGNRMLGDGVGPSFANRLERDVLQQTGAVGVLMLGGVNDLSLLVSGSLSTPSLSSMVAGYQDLITRVRNQGLSIWLSPLTPAGNVLTPSLFGHSSFPEQVQRRQEVNQWIRSSSGAYDSRFNLDPVVANWLVPTALQLRYNSGDNIHPNSAGHAAMGGSIPLSLFDGVRRCAP
jgi:lysophospholipase L1-like esterase